MSRIVDEPYFTYSAYDALTSGIQVKCPKCHGTGVVTADEDIPAMSLPVGQMIMWPSPAFSESDGKRTAPSVERWAVSL